MIEIEFLWFSDCPNRDAARDLLAEVLEARGLAVPIREIDATDPAIAERVRFPGSPTIRVNGTDIMPGFRNPGDYTPRCRVYHTSAGLRGVPERAWIEAAIDAALAEQG
jgi:hypothetical protein